MKADLRAGLTEVPASLRPPRSHVAAFDRQERTIQIQVGASASRMGTLRYGKGTVPIAERTVPIVQRTPPNSERTVPVKESTAPIRVRTLAMPMGTVPTSERADRLSLRTVPIPMGALPILLRTVAIPVESVPIPIGGVPSGRAPAVRPRGAVRSREPFAEKPEPIIRFLGWIAREPFAGPRRRLVRNRQ